MDETQAGIFTINTNSGVQGDDLFSQKIVSVEKAVRPLIIPYAFHFSALTPFNPAGFRARWFDETGIFKRLGYSITYISGHAAWTFHLEEGFF